MKRSFIDLTRISGAVVFVFLFMNYNNLSKVNLREREKIAGLKEIIFKTIKQLRRIFYVGVFYFERSALKLRD